MTCDREHYSADLGSDLRAAWQSLMRGPLCCSEANVSWCRAPKDPCAFGKGRVSQCGYFPKVYVGDWLSASFTPGADHARYAKQYAELIGDAKPEFLHFEALLLMRESQALIDFYKAVKADPRRKIYMGPLANKEAALMLGAKFLPTPMDSLFSYRDAYSKVLLHSDFDVLLYGSGMAGNIPVVACWEAYPEKTYINLGSALDPLGRGKSRQQQIAVDRAKKLFQELL